MYHAGTPTCDQRGGKKKSAINLLKPSRRISNFTSAGTEGSMIATLVPAAAVVVALVLQLAIHHVQEGHVSTLN